MGITLKIAMSPNIMDSPFLRPGVMEQHEVIPSVNTPQNPVIIHVAKLISAILQNPSHSHFFSFGPYH
jgi:hypothetical protein